MAKSEGKEVRVAFNGPDLEHDQLIDFIGARNREDGQRATSAGESRQKIGAFLEETGMNSQALSWCRSILKKKDQAKQMDVIMSLKKALPMIEAHVAGQGTAELPLEDEDGDLEDDFGDDFEGYEDEEIPVSDEEAA